VALDEVLDRAAWRYFDGRAWSAAIGDRRTLFDAGPNMKVFFCPYLERWVVAWSALFSNDVYARTATALTGPWSDPVKLFTADHKSSMGTTYDALPHPEYAEQDGKVQYFTYSRPTGGWFNSEFALVRVELERR
jgi:hypothetical protein